MAFEKSVEAVIREAIARGEFESLAGAGARDSGLA